MNDELYKKVVTWLRTRTPLKPDSITPETEIYADLRIYGDDLFEFLIWISDEFGLQITVAGEKYAPSEMPFFKVIEAFKKAIGGESHRYKSLKVRDVAQAIEAGGGWSVQLKMGTLLDYRHVSLRGDRKSHSLDSARPYSDRNA